MYSPLTDPTQPGIRHSPEPLVAAFRESSPFFFASAHEALLAQTEHAATYVRRSADPALAEFVAQGLRELEQTHGQGARAALALPFLASDDAQGWLLRKVETTRGRAGAGSIDAAAALEGQPGYAVRFHPAPRKYMEAVSSALRAIAAGELEKVVMSRMLELSFAERVDSAEWLRRFYAQNPAGYVFALNLAAPGEAAHKLMGASPELLLQKRGLRVSTNPLAGSRPRGESAAKDEANAHALLESEKDHREHALVVEAVARALAPFCSALDVPARPKLLSTPTMWHLSTSISGQLRDPQCSSLALVQALHPTPAVAGYPREQALARIAELEDKPRGLFAGAIGHCDARGDGEWAVSLRCAELRERSALLFAGAGVVAGSDPRAELDETSAKFRTALRALGVPLLAGAS